jgi:hypothetical protein
MFRVECTSPLDGDWHERDLELLTAAGRPSEFHGAGIQHGSNRRLHVWTVTTAEEAFELREQLQEVEGADATVWEFSDSGPAPRDHHPADHPPPILPHPSAG